MGLLLKSKGSTINDLGGLGLEEKSKMNLFFPFFRVNLQESGDPL